jgi:hypothetical protein
MADTFSNDLRLRLQESGSNAGTWGDLLNGTITNIASGFGQGSEAIPNASTHTITLADGTADEARSLYLKCTGGGQACTVTLGPNTISKVWIIDNATSYTLTFSQGSGANVAIAAGAVKVIATDGAGSGAAVVDTLDGLEGSLSTLAVSGALTVDTNTLVVDATNNQVGIGITPATLLDIKESTAATDAIIGLTAGTGGRAQIRSEAQADNTSSELSFYTMSGSNTSEAMRISGSNVGIGTSSPATQLFVKSASNAANVFAIESADAGQRLQIGVNTSNGGSYIFEQKAQAIRFGTSDTERLRIDQNGWVNVNANIATDNPADSQGLHFGWNYSNAEGESLIVFNKGGGSVGGLLFSDNSADGTPVERMRIDSLGAVRIVKNGGTGFTPLSYDGLVVQNGDATGIRIIDAGNGGGNGGHTGLGNDNGNLRVMTAGTMVFATGLSPTDQLFEGGDERMRITSAGKLVVNGTVAGYSGTNITVGDPSHSSAGLSILSSTTGHGYLLFGDATGDATGGYSGQINYAHSTNRMGFNTNNVERLVIDSTGRLLVGKPTSVYSGVFEAQQTAGGAVSAAITCTHASQPYGLLLHFTGASPDNHTNYFITGADSTTNRFFVYSDGDVWTSDSGTLTSDERLKTNVQDATSKLDDLLALRVRNFEWIPEYHPNKVGEKKIGFIAQEFEQTFPALVSENTFELNGEEVTRKSVRMGALIPILVKGMQEQQALIESQAAAITDLTTRLTALENK